MSPTELLITLLLGGLMGLLGQGARAVVGLKGVADASGTPNVSQNDVFQAARLYNSLVLGFLVGLAAALIYVAGLPHDVAVVAGAPGAAPPPFKPDTNLLDWHVLLGFAAAGYVGVDFLEGFISSYLLPKTGANIEAGRVSESAGTNYSEVVSDLAFKKTPAKPKKPTFAQLSQIIIRFLVDKYPNNTVDTSTLLADPKPPKDGLLMAGGTDINQRANQIDDSLQGAGYQRAFIAQTDLDTLIANDKTIEDLIKLFAKALKVSIPA